MEDTHLPNNDWTGYTILKSYYRAEGDTVAMEALDIERDRHQQKIPKDWPFLDDDYAEQFIANLRDYDSQTALALAAEDSRSRYQDDPGLCVM